MTNINIDEIEKSILHIAKIAKKHILENLDRVDILSAKGRDIKINLDKETDKLIKDYLLINSSYPVLAEESGLDDHQPTPSSYLWVVDPIDGTFNLQRSIPHYCISIALLKDNNPYIGAIIDLNSNDIFFAAPKKATLNGLKISTSQTNTTEQAVICTGFPVDTNFDDESTFTTFKNLQKYKKVRMLGSAATSLSYVACGKVDIYSEKNIRIWDVAAGLALVKSAGGKFQIKVNTEDSTLLDVLATNGKLGLI